MIPTMILNNTSPATHRILWILIVSSLFTENFFQFTAKKTLNTTTDSDEPPDVDVSSDEAG
jgi:hypothetical protein